MTGNAATSLLCLGPSHKTAAVATRERFAIVGLRGEALLRSLHARDDVHEVVALTTCNRSELYLAVSDADAALDAALDACASYAGVTRDEAAAMLAVRSDEAAAAHLFRVAAGIESLVIGEAQIQGQLKDALGRAHDDGTCGAVLDNLLRRALEVGKRVRRETLIGAGKASIGTAAAELVVRSLGTLDGASVLVIGAGKMSGLAARCLAARGATGVFVANRHRERATELAEMCGGEAVPFECIDDELERCDVVISSTSAPHLLITGERMAAVVARRAGRPIVLVDLAVPRDIDPAIAGLDGCHLFDLDDLEQVVLDTLDVRAGELDVACGLVADAAASFMGWWRSQDALPAIMAMRTRAEQVRAAEVDRFLRRMEHLAPGDRDRVEQLTRTIVAKLLHEPTVRLREAVAEQAAAVGGHQSGGMDDGAVDPLIDAVERLFGALEAGSRSPAGQ